MKKQFSKSLTCITVLVLSLVMLTACNKPTPPVDPSSSPTPQAAKETPDVTETPADKKGGIMILQTWTDLSNSNFYADNGGTGAALYWSCGPMLCTYNADNEIIGLLLKSWELSDDGLTWTFHMRENAGWSDGEPITSDDIIFSIEYFRQSGFSGVVFQRDTDYFNETPLYAKVDEHTYTVTTKVPYPTIFDYYAVNCFIIPKHIFNDVPASEFHTTKVNTVPGEIVCGGPFKITEQKIGEYIKCEPNEYFWDTVYLDELYWRIAADPNSMYTSIMSGDLDFTFGSGNHYEDAVSAGMQILRTGGADYAGYAMNTKDPILSDVNIRKAISHIYDQQVFINQIAGGQGVINKGFVAGMRYEDTDACVYYEHDVEKAKKLIEESGWKMEDDGYYYKDGQPLEINFIYEAGFEDNTAMLFETMFKDTGVKFTYNGYDAGVLEDKKAKGEFQICSTSARLGIDPANYYSSYISEALFGFYRSEKLDKLWIDGANGKNDEERQKAYSALQHEFTDAAVWLPIYDGWGYYFASPSCGLDEAQFTSNGMFVYFNKLYKISK